MVFLALLICIVTAILAYYFNKRLLSTEPAIKVIGFSFFGCVIFSLVAILFAGHSFTFYHSVFIVGLINSYGAFFSAKAIKINLAQSMIFLPLTGFVGVLLAVLFLGEGSFLNPFKLSGFLSVLGVVGSFFAMLFFINGAGVARQMRKKWALFIAGQTLISGVAIFFIKYVAVQDIAITSYLVSWYAGAWLGSLTVLVFGPKTVLGVERKNYFLYFFLSLSTWLSMGSYFLVLRKAPASFVFPIQYFLVVFGSLLVGLFVFHERKSFCWKDWAGMAIGLVSVALIVIGMNLL